MLTVIGIPNCDQIRKTLKWLDAQQIEYQFVNVKKEPLTTQEISELGAKVTFDALVNRRGTTWRQLGLSGADLTDAQLTELILKHQTLMKRPVIVDEDGAVMVGFDEEALSGFAAGREE